MEGGLAWGEWAGKVWRGVVCGGGVQGYVKKYRAGSQRWGVAAIERRGVALRHQNEGGGGGDGGV